MKEYKNLSKKSLVQRYQVGDDFIIVEFVEGHNKYHKYTCESAGEENITVMKRLATQGRDLYAFISINLSEMCDCVW